jgi:hypothetical protein
MLELSSLAGRDDRGLFELELVNVLVAVGHCALLIHFIYRGTTRLAGLLETTFSARIEDKSFLMVNHQKLHLSQAVLAQT